MFGEGCDHTAGAVGDGSPLQCLLDADSLNDGGGGGAGHDGAHLVKGDGPIDKGEAADVVDDGRCDGGCHEAVYRVQPNAEAQHDETAEQARCVQAAPGVAGLDASR